MTDEKLHLDLKEKLEEAKVKDLTAQRPVVPPSDSHYALKEPYLRLDHAGYAEDFGEKYGKPVKIETFPISLRLVLGGQNPLDGANGYLSVCRDAYGTDTRLGHAIDKATQDMGIEPPHHVFVLNMLPFQDGATAVDRVITLSKATVDSLNDAELDAVLKHEMRHLDQNYTKRIGENHGIPEVLTRNIESKMGSALSAIRTASDETGHDVYDCISLADANWYFSPAAEFDADAAAIRAGASADALLSALSKFCKNNLKAIGLAPGDGARNVAALLKDFGSEALQKKFRGVTPETYGDFLDSLTERQCLEYSHILSAAKRYFHHAPRTHPSWRERLKAAKEIEKVRDSGLAGRE